MDIREYMKEHFLLLDGGMGSLLQAAGLKPGERPERWNLDNPEAVLAAQRDYFDAGCNVVLTNTFGANARHFSPEELAEIVPAAIRIARRASEESRGAQAKFVALDIGPSGALLSPWGDLEFEDAVELFAQVVRLGAGEADLIFIETMGDAAETRAALLAARENSDLPVFVSNSYGANNRLLTGATPAAMVAMLEGMGADAIGVNCSQGPESLSAVAEEYVRAASVPVFFKPNAGLPELVDGKTVYRMDAQTFAAQVSGCARRGISGAGGCCGTTPAHLSALAQQLSGFVPRRPREGRLPCIASQVKTVSFGDGAVCIGDRINPSCSALLRRGLLEGDTEPAVDAAMEQAENGADALDVNLGLPGVDRAALMAETVTDIQTSVALPLAIDTADSAVMESALRAYTGKALLNSVSLRSAGDIFPLMKKYGGMAVALLLREDMTVPETAEERLAVADRLLAAAAAYGLGEEDILFDPITLPLSADPGAGEALETLRLLKERGLRALAAVSNVSHGQREPKAVESAFLALSIAAGADAVLCDPAVEPCPLGQAEAILEQLGKNQGGYDT